MTRLRMHIATDFTKQIYLFLAALQTFSSIGFVSASKGILCKNSHKCEQRLIIGVIIIIIIIIVVVITVACSVETRAATFHKMSTGTRLRHPSDSRSGVYRGKHKTSRIGRKSPIAWQQARAFLVVYVAMIDGCSSLSPVASSSDSTALSGFVQSLRYTKPLLFARHHRHQR